MNRLLPDAIPRHIAGSNARRHAVRRYRSLPQTGSPGGEGLPAWGAPIPSRQKFGVTLCSAQSILASSVVTEGFLLTLTNRLAPALSLRMMG